MAENPPDASGTDPVESAWAQVLDRWDDEEAHRRFRGLCAALGRLPEAGQRYRAVRDSDPDLRRREDASGHIDALLTVAMQSLEATRAPEVDTGRARRTLFFVATGLTLTLVLGALWLWVS